MAARSLKWRPPARLPGDSIGDWEIISPVKMINNSMRGLELECAALSLGSLGGR